MWSPLPPLIAQVPHATLGWAGLGLAEMGVGRFLKAAVQAQAASSTVRVAQHSAYLQFPTGTWPPPSLFWAPPSPDSRFLWKQPLLPPPYMSLTIQSFIPRGSRKQLLTSLVQFPCQGESLAYCHLPLPSTRSLETHPGPHAEALLPEAWGDGTPCCSLTQLPHPSSTRPHHKGVC